VLRPGRDQITVDRVAELMTKRYEIEEVDTARNVLLVHAQNLCYKMDHPRSKAAIFLADEPIYRELGMGHDLPAADIRKAQAVALRPRKDHAPLERADSDTSSDSESIEEVVVTPQRQADRRKKKGRLSVLRPKSSKFSGKGKTLQSRKGPGLGDHSSQAADSSADPDAEVDSDSESIAEIDTSTEALSPTREKRKLIDIEGDEEEDRRRKRAASSSISQESIPSTSNSDTEAAAEADNEAPLPLRKRANLPLTNGKPSGSRAKSELVAPIVSTPLPTYEANGPRDSWICTFDGCHQRVYGASKPIGRQLITEHLEDHSKGRQQVVGVVWRENQKLALPVK
jgi:hypothetical protein